MARYLVTGGAGFIGSAVVRHLVRDTLHEVAVVDKMTYAGNVDSLPPTGGGRFVLFRGDIGDAKRMAEVFAQVQPQIVMHLAAETHVDRSIDGAAAFIQTNIVGTSVLLEAATNYWRKLPPDGGQRRFLFHHISTDEVFGALGDHGAFTEASPYAPKSPYSASKASADHLVRAWHATYGLPVVLSSCSNNYGPYQFPEKLIPLVILNALEGRELPVYGKGANVRDWLYVEDHVRALLLIAERGRVGETYCVGGEGGRTNLAVVEAVCAILDRMLADGRKRRELIRFVADRPGHDFRYAIDPAKIRSELGWAASETFESGLEKTVRWYLENRAWWSRIRDSVYRGERLGMVT